jgi:hypothetical protein
MTDKARVRVHVSWRDRMLRRTSELRSRHGVGGKQNRARWSALSVLQWECLGEWREGVDKVARPQLLRIVSSGAGTWCCRSAAFHPA